MDTKKIESLVETDFNEEVLPGLKGNSPKLFIAFIEIPNVSPGFDPDWEKNGLAEKAVNHIVQWVNNQKIAGCTAEILKEPGRSHTILIVIEATNPKPDEKTLFFYSHCDKQPPLTENWKEGLHPYKPTIVGDRLYGRGSSDDGYAPFVVISAIKTCQKLGLPHDRCVMLIESCEESGSLDLGFYVQNVMDKIKSPSIMFILDSGCGDYERIWVTTTLRGMLRMFAHNLSL